MTRKHIADQLREINRRHEALAKYAVTTTTAIYDDLTPLPPQPRHILPANAEALQRFYAAARKRETRKRLAYALLAYTVVICAFVGPVIAYNLGLNR